MNHQNFYRNVFMSISSMLSEIGLWLLIYVICGQCYNCISGVFKQRTNVSTTISCEQKLYITKYFYVKVLFL